MIRALAVLGLLVVAADARADVEADAIARLNAGVAHYQLGQLEEARADFIAARDLQPDRANPHRWLGLTEARLDHCPDAIVELDQFLRSVPPRDARVAEATAVRDLCKQKLSPPPVATPAIVVVAPPPPPPRRRRAWIAGVVVGGVAVVGLAVGLGVGLTRRGGIHAYPPVVGSP